MNGNDDWHFVKLVGLVFFLWYHGSWSDFDVLVCGSVGTLKCTENAVTSPATTVYFPTCNGGCAAVQSIAPAGSSRLHGSSRSMYVVSLTYVLPLLHCLSCWNMQFLCITFLPVCKLTTTFTITLVKRWIWMLDPPVLSLHGLLFALSLTLQQLLIYLLFLPSFLPPLLSSIEFSLQSLCYYLTAILCLPVLAQQSEGERNNF